MERIGASHSGTAMLANAVLQDFGIITADNTDYVVTQSKIERELNSWHEVLKQTKFDNEEVRSIYFDGRKDETCVAEKKGSTRHPGKKRQENITILKEPGEVFLGHAVPATDSAEDQQKAICNFLTAKSIDMSKLGMKEYKISFCFIFYFILFEQLCLHLYFWHSETTVLKNEQKIKKMKQKFYEN